MGSYADQPDRDDPVGRVPDRTLELPAADEAMPRTVPIGGVPIGGVPIGGGVVAPVDRTPLAAIGTITVTRDRIYTPTGSFRLRGSRWTVVERPFLRQRIPNWAIALAVTLFFCLGPFSLLFLLATETVYVPGLVEVSVRSGRHHYVAQVPVGDPVALQYLHHQVNYIRQLAAE